jgi:hypothetical protein
MKRAMWVVVATSLIAGMIVSTPAHAALFAFTSHTFNSCSTSGPTGPTVTACRSAYSTTWDEDSSNYSVTSGIQYWTVPATGRYFIDAYGAGGGGTLGGGGARIADTFNLTEGEVIRILVGQTPATTAVNANSGGGGTFVVRSPFNTEASILIIAGGGGGTESGLSQNSNAHASTSTSGNQGTGTVAAGSSGAGGTAGSGGGAASSDNSGGGGGGFLTNGTRNSNWDNNGGTAFVNGGAGAVAGTVNVAAIAGGFGGGGGSAGKGAGGGAGGGGGYSGGGGGDNTGGYSGGGGGSYFANGLNINRVLTVDANAENNNGSVTITQLAPPTLALSIAGAVAQVSKGQVITLSAVIDQAGSVTFYTDGKRIAGCINLIATVGTKTCAWRPTVQKSVQVSAILRQSGSIVASSQLSVSAKKRTGLR